MKKILRHLVIDTLALFAVSTFTEGIVFEEGFKSLILAGIGLTVASLVAKPVINLLLLPVNLVTFNLFRWISSAIALYLVTLVVPGFKIVGFYFSGLTSSLVNIPVINISGVLAFVLFSFLISLITSLFYWIAT